MTRRISVAVAGCASAAAILWVATALAAYGSPRLEVSQQGARVTLDLAQSPGDDATAIVRVISPIGTEIADARPIGTTIGAASGTLVPTQPGAAPIEAQGPLRVVGGAPAAATTGCTVGERVLAVWGIALTGGSLSLDLPVYVLVGGDLLVCLPHPSTQDRGARLVRLQLTFDGPLDVPLAGTWISIWVPYGGAVADASRVVASPAVVGPGAVSFTARARGTGAVLVGFVRHGSSIRTDARVRITGGPRATSQRLLGTARTNRQGRFTFRAKSGTVFRATATVPRASPPGLCFVLESFLRPIPCVNPTVNGFTVQSAPVRKR